MSYVSPSRPRLFTKDTPSSISGDTFPFATSLFVPLFHLPTMSFLSQMPRSRGQRLLLLANLKLRPSSSPFFSPSTTRLFFRSASSLIHHSSMISGARNCTLLQYFTSCTILLPQSSPWSLRPSSSSSSSSCRSSKTLCLSRRQPPPLPPAVDFFFSRFLFWRTDRRGYLYLKVDQNTLGALWSVNVLLSISRGSSSPYIYI